MEQLSKWRYKSPCSTSCLEPLYPPPQPPLTPTPGYAVPIPYFMQIFFVVLLLLIRCLFFYRCCPKAKKLNIKYFAFPSFTAIFITHTYTVYANHFGACSDSQTLSEFSSCSVQLAGNWNLVNHMALEKKEKQLM